LAAQKTDADAATDRLELSLSVGIVGDQVVDLADDAGGYDQGIRHRKPERSPPRGRLLAQRAGRI
jgi:hypothetical protein